jgi:hypothetical protein
MAALKLFSGEQNVRLKAVATLIKEPNEALLPLLDKALTTEKDAAVLTQLELARSAAMLGSDDVAKRLAAAKALAMSKTPATQLLLNQRLSEEGDAAVKSAIQASLRTIAETLVWGERLGAWCSPASAWARSWYWRRLGLAITYGPDGGHQHGARRADDDRRLCHLRHPEPVPPRTCQVSVRLPMCWWPCPHELPGRRRCGRGARARRDPLAVRPPARDPAGLLGHQPDPDATGAQHLRCAERAGREPLVVVRRCSTC